MSYENRQEDIDKILNMKEVGEKLSLNMFQDGGSSVVKIGTTTYELYEIPLYGGKPQYCGTFHAWNVDKMVDIIYDVFI